MKAVFLPSHFDGDGYYRLLFPARELGRRGWNVEIAPHVVEPLNGRPATLAHFGVYEHLGGGTMKQLKSIDEWLGEQDFDVLVMQQRVEPWWPECLRVAQEVGKKVVVDSDDCWLDLPSWNPGSKKPQAHVDAMLEMLRVADAMSVATPELTEVYKPYAKSTVIRNRLDWPMWEDVTPAYEVERRRLRIGWMGEVAWRRGDIEVLKHMVAPWLVEHPEVEFVAAGDPLVHDIVGVPEGQRVTTNRTDFMAMDLADITATMDIGLVPFAALSQRSRRLNDCKSHLKGMEYNACGIPCIATPTESYEWWVEPGENGFLASTEQEWRAALDALLDTAERERMGRAARLKASQSTVQEHIGDWSTFLTGVCLGVDTDAPRPKVAA